MAPAGIVVWITGLPASGKTTLAERVRDRLGAAGRPCAILDGDEARAAQLPPPGDGPDGRERLYATLARLSTLLARKGLVVLVPATAHRRPWRDAARALAPRFLEVHVTTALEECERRDPRQQYARARAGALPDLPGVGAVYEPPAAPDVVADGGLDDQALTGILALLTPARPDSAV